MRSFFCKHLWLAAASLILPCAAPAQQLLVVGQLDQSLHIFNAATLQQTASVKEDGITGHEVAASADGKTAYVPIYSDTGVGKPGTNGDHIDVIDIASAKQTGTISFGHGVRPHMIVLDPHTGNLLVTTELDKAVSIVDPRQGKVIAQIPTGSEQSHTVALSPDGTRAYTANVGTGSVSVLDVPGRKLLKVIPVSSNTQRISVSRDGRYAFTADQAKPELVVIDTAVMSVARRIPLPASAYGTAPTLDGRRLLVAMRSQDKIAVIDLHTMQVERTIDTPKEIYEIVMNADGKTAYASCAASGQVVAIDLQTLTVTNHAGGMSYPDGMTFVAQH